MMSTNENTSTLGMFSAGYSHDTDHNPHISIDIAVIAGPNMLITRKIKFLKDIRIRIAHTITILVCVCCLGGIALALFVGLGYREIDKHTTELSADSRVFFVLKAI